MKWEEFNLNSGLVNKRKIGEEASLVTIQGIIQLIDELIMYAKTISNI